MFNGGGGGVFRRARAWWSEEVELGGGEGVLQLIVAIAVCRGEHQELLSA